MVAVVHDDYVFSLGVRGRTETSPKNSEQKDMAHVTNPNKHNDHFVTPRPTRDRRNIRAASHRQRACPAKLDPGDTFGLVAPTRGVGGFVRGSIRRQLFQHSEIWKTQRFKIIGGPCASQPRSDEGTIPTPRWHLAASKRLANAHSECVTIPSLSDIGSQIDVVLLT